VKRSSCIAAVLFALIAPRAGAEDRWAGDLGKADLGKAPSARAADANTDSGSSAAIRRVLAREYTLPPHTIAFFDMPADLSGAKQIGISITSASDSRTRLSDVTIGVAFAAPGEYYVLTDVIFGSNFYYTDHGGATVPVYGPLMRLVVTNDTPSLVRITQLAAYAVFQ
jgi:hypothetical protein